MDRQLSDAKQMTMRRINSSLGEVSDEALLAGMAEGDERATLVFVRRYQRRVFGLAYSMVGDSGIAEDIAQEALLRAWRHAQVFDPRRGSVTSWLLTITRNLSIDSLRIRRSTPIEPERIFEIIGFDRDSEQAYTRSDQATTIRDALSQLPSDQRNAVLLCSLYGYTAAQVSEAERIPLGTAKSRIRIGLTKLRIALETTEESK